MHANTAERSCVARVNFRAQSQRWGGRKHTDSTLCASLRGGARAPSRGAERSRCHDRPSRHSGVADALSPAAGFQRCHAFVCDFRATPRGHRAISERCACQLEKQCISFHRRRRSTARRIRSSAPRRSGGAVGGSAGLGERTDQEPNLRKNWARHAEAAVVAWAGDGAHDAPSHRTQWPLHGAATSGCMQRGARQAALARRRHSRPPDRCQAVLVFLGAPGHGCWIRGGVLPQF